MTKAEKIQWILDQHKDTNHMYDKYLPYEFHLRIVVEVGKKFMHLLPKSLGISEENLELALWSHDLIEDTRVTYNDVKKVLGKDVADIVYALTNEKGRNRKERAGDRYYNGIVSQPGATFGKLCDRIGNVQYGIMTGSDMPKMYKKENSNFIEKLKIEEAEGTEYLLPMVEYLEELFEEA